MGNLPIIGITSNEKPVSDKLPIVHLSVSKNFGVAIRKAGGLPFYIPLSKEKFAKDYIKAIDKLLLTGGQNASPKFYGESKQTDSQDYFEERDVWELALIKEALRQNKPILAVCRGMQLYNVAQGGSLNQEIAHHADFLPTQLAHQVRIARDSQLFGLFGESLSVNSVHRQSLKTLAPHLKAVAWSEVDNVIEAVEATDDRRFLGVQWHPEFLIEPNLKNQALFDYFVQKL